MCGIAGFLNFLPSRSPQAIRDLVLAMNQAQAHRGPDADGYWADAENRCHLGHRRLSIIDLSTAANQPMLDETGRYAMAFNGEIYNFKDLRRDLEARGIQFRTHSDTEVLLRLFIAEGPAAFKRCDGMFAVAIYDTHTKTLTLARDRCGEKPLYVATTAGFFAFASELRALTALPDFTYEISETGLALYMALRYVPPPRTIFEGIGKLEPGCFLQIGPDGVQRRERYFHFQIDDARAAAPQDIDAYAEQVEAALQSSLEARLNSDVPLGAFLSSGVDSSLVCAILAKKMQRRLHTYTVGFADDAQSEDTAARAIARHLGTQHEDFVFGAADFDAICGKIGTLLDEPNGDRSCVPTYLLSQFARQHVKVAISGDGGDELFAGYGRYIAFMAQTAQTKWPSAAAIPQYYFSAALPVFPWQAIQDVAPGGMGEVQGFTGSFGNLFTAPGRNMLNALRLLDFETYMPGAVLAKVDRMSMQHGLEVRTPYLSPALMALSSTAPLPALFDGKAQKAVLRRLMAKYVPQEFAYAPKKGFGMPASVFLQNADRVRAEINSAIGALAQSSFFAARKGSIEKLAVWAGHNTNSIWATIVLGKWIESLGRPV